MLRMLLICLVIIAIQTKVSTAYSISNICRSYGFINLKFNSAYDSVCRSSYGAAQKPIHLNYKYKHIPSNLQMVEIAEFGDADEEHPVQVEKPKTYGYEGNFQVGDVVKVTKPIRIWSVKQYMKEGFICEGFVGKVVGLALYGRKFNSLCSAITPVKVSLSRLYTFIHT